MTNDHGALFARARHVIPGGVNSPVRAFRAVGGTPPFIARGEGARVWDEHGRAYLDYVGAWGPLLFGHAYAPVVQAVQDVAADGVCFGAPTRLEVEFAEALIRLSGWLEQVRVMNSGTEAAMTAARLVRAVTGRPTILKFDGGYHGHGDAFLTSGVDAPAADADLATQRKRPGLALASDAAQGEASGAVSVPAVVLATYNDLDSVRRAVALCQGRVAGIFVEPVCANVGVVAPGPGFLEGLRAVCDEIGALLVFDEVVTGCRLGRGGAVECFGVRPDLATFAKVIGGGLPIGAVGGPRVLMSQLAPEGPVFHAGTFCGNPVSMAAGLAQLRAIEADPDLYRRLDHLGAQLQRGVGDALAGAGVVGQFARVGSMWTLFFAAAPVVNAAGARGSDTRAYASFFHAMLRRGVSLTPSQFEANFISAAHTESDVTRTIEVVTQSLGEL